MVVWCGPGGGRRPRKTGGFFLGGGGGGGGVDGMGERHSVVKGVGSAVVAVKPLGRRGGGWAGSGEHARRRLRSEQQIELRSRSPTEVATPAACCKPARPLALRHASPTVGV